jgi:hypothetical protein
VSSEDKAPETVAGFDRDSQVRPKTGLGLKIRNRVIPIAKAEIVMGRAVDCDVVLDGPLVSRRHARILVSEAGMTVEDLGSRNGVQVDGKTITGPTPIQKGSRVVAGDEALVVVELDAEMKRRVTAVDFRSAHTMRFDQATQPEPFFAKPKIVEAEDPGENTLRAQSFELLSAVSDKALAMGRGEDAERVLGGVLADALRDAQKQGKLPDGIGEKAARYAVKLAQATGKASFIDYVFRLYMALKEPVPLPIVDDMYTVLRKVRGIDRRLLGDYLDLLRSKNLGPAGRFAIQRIEGLNRLAGL